MFQNAPKMKYNQSFVQNRAIDRWGAVRKKWF